MASFDIRPLAEGYLSSLAELWGQVFEGAYRSAEVDEKSLRSMTFECHQFDEAGSFVALDGGTVVGAVLSFGAREFENDLYWHTIVAGWIGAVLVARDRRRQGVGARLLHEAEVFHEQRGRLVVFAGGGEGIATPFHGVEEGWTEAHAFLRAQGYHWARRTCAVDIDLTHYRPPEAVLAKQQALAGEEVEVHLGRPADADAYRQYLADQGYADWQKTFERWQARPDRTVLALAGGHVVGHCRGIYVSTSGRAGYSNIVTQPQFRNRGIGTVMLVRAVERARELGGTSMPLWTRPKTAERFYVKLGFQVVRTFDTFGKVLQQELLSESWIARHRYL